MNNYKSNCESMESFLNLQPETKESGGKKVCTACSACREEACEMHADHVSLKCGTPMSTNIPETAAVGDVFNVANVNVDTDKYHHPCIRFEFVGNLATAAGTVTLNFQIQKQCKYQAAALPVGPVWTFSRETATISESNVFTFAVCDCDLCDGECCNYSVVATVAALAVEEPVVISNASLSALVVEHTHC